MELNDFFKLDVRKTDTIKLSYLLLQILNIVSCTCIAVAYLVLAISDDASYLIGILVALILLIAVGLGLNVIFGMFYDIRMMRICAENGQSQFQPSVAPSEAPTVTPSVSTNNSTPNPTTWKCLCGNVNPNYQMYCECGKSKEDFVKFNNNKVKVQTSLLENGGWKCDCGIVNAQYVTTCGCGRNKREVLASRQNNK